MKRALTGVERRFDDDQVIVTKSDLKGRITYANQTFFAVSGFTEREVLGAPHSILRHPAMPRAAFHLMWQTITGGGEFFGYVLNRARNGDHYWVFAHVTPSRDGQGRITGYHSNRRAPDPHVVATVVAPLYQRLLREEGRHDSPAAAIAAGGRLLTQTLTDLDTDYDRYMFSLEG
ncbi:PAS domain-containing protein [Nitrospirillum iridis]|uniref:PAS domain S-box-containing protein n=1 Tax=Nitrospirillum iridis TaxID=765888 RepID=A0A7X0AWC1_9PROT|nr:PAS domain-containing protein [Nitrospirillum iridis]MBB6249879.1 PAS domain S-box-containing protein [Nitrospirillum iridis]